MKIRHSKWKFHIVWEQIPEFARAGDNHLCLPYTAAQKEKPTLQNINISAPDYDKDWKAIDIVGIELIREGNYPEETLPEEPKK